METVVPKEDNENKEYLILKAPENVPPPKS